MWLESYIVFPYKIYRAYVKNYDARYLYETSYNFILNKTKLLFFMMIAKNYIPNILVY